MLSFWRTYCSAFLTWIFCGIFAVIGFFVLHPVYFDICEATKNGTGQKCEPYHVVVFPFYKVAEILSHAEAWTALATIAIAIFTYTLKRSTDNLWEAGERSLRTSNRAWVFTGPHDPTVQARDGRFTFRLIAINYGKSPAHVRRIYVEFAAVEPLTGEPAYDRNAPIEMNFPVGPYKDIVSLTDEFQTDRNEPFVIGYIDYSDALVTTTEADFAASSAVQERLCPLAAAPIMSGTDATNAIPACRAKFTIAPSLRAR